MIRWVLVDSVNNAMAIKSPLFLQHFNKQPEKTPKYQEDTKEWCSVFYFPTIDPKDPRENEETKECEKERS